MTIDQLKTIIQSTHLNFLFGSGCSVPFLSALGNIELLLAEIPTLAIDTDQKEIIRASVLKDYFEKSIYNNTELISNAPNADRDAVNKKYEDFIKALYYILLYRRTDLLNKQANIFTTNMDIFFEVNSEKIGVSLNDGFKGRIKPKFDMSNFKKSIYKTSQLFGNKSEIPSINFYKLHGSVNWKIEDGEINFDSTLGNIKTIQALPLVLGTDIITLNDPASGDSKPLATLVSETAGLTLTDNAKEFLSQYDVLPIINPTKEKFKETTMNYTYYELIRIMSNELEKENSLLFVMGFSFADEHFQEVIMRAANSNPTLKILIYAYSSAGETEISKNLGLSDGKNIYNNISFVERENAGDPAEEKFDLSVINSKHFNALSNSLKDNFEK